MRLAPLFALLLAACGHVDYDATPAGEFRGSLFVMWVGEGGKAGDGRFVYVPNPRDPLRLVRGGDAPSPGVIQPEMIYTDGGSIPRAGQLFNGFAPWGYAPAYMIHDWLFVARHCLTDGAPTRAEREIADMEFHESAEIIAEAIKALIASGQALPNDVAPRVIAGTVAGPISYDRWTVRGACATDRVTEAHRAAAEAAIPGAGAAQRKLRQMTDATGAPLAAARLVTTLSF
ncbi:MAG: hypothetical protein AB7S99_14300 [Pseudodonghicola sp.]